jgi:hypothetical protein
MTNILPSDFISLLRNEDRTQFFKNANLGVFAEQAPEDISTELYQVKFPEGLPVEYVPANGAFNGGVDLINRFVTRTLKKTKVSTTLKVNLGFVKDTPFDVVALQEILDTNKKFCVAAPSTKAGLSAYLTGDYDETWPTIIEDLFARVDHAICIDELPKVRIYNPRYQPVEDGYIFEFNYTIEHIDRDPTVFYLDVMGREAIYSSFIDDLANKQKV